MMTEVVEGDEVALNKPLSLCHLRTGRRSFGARNAIPLSLNHLTSPLQYVGRPGLCCPAPAGPKKGGSPRTQSRHLRVDERGAHRWRHLRVRAAHRPPDHLIE